MTDKAPERIWAWYFITQKQNECMKGGWDDLYDSKSTEYIRADINKALEAERDALKETINQMRAIVEENDRLRVEVGIPYGRRETTDTSYIATTGHGRKAD